eukprot:136820-Alexandrium_andersonii.AAC.1
MRSTAMLAGVMPMVGSNNAHRRVQTDCCDTFQKRTWTGNEDRVSNAATSGNPAWGSNRSPTARPCSGKARVRQRPCDPASRLS